MKVIKHIQTWLLITLLALSANGAVSAKVASGGINLSNEVHQGLNDFKSLNALVGISDVSTIHALGSSIVPNAGADDGLYNRGSFRKSTNQRAIEEAPKNADGQMICTTCGDDIPEVITQQTKNGPRQRRGHDLDHYPETWSERVNRMKQQETPPTRKEVLDEFNKDIRAQCPECNQGHQFEGIEGTFKGVDPDA